MRNHSSVHLLQAALRRVLGTHVEQSGSYVDENRARFDFTHTAALTPDELQQVELLVNEQILAGSAVTATEMPIDEAKKLGAMALFGEKYGDVVRVVRMGDFSVELCGGTHIDDTAKIGMFKILGESSVASGVRRIEAVTGLNTLGLLHAQENSLLAMRAVLKANSVDELVNKAEALQNEFKFIKKALEKANITAAFTQIAAELEKAETVGGLRLVTSRFADIPVDALREASDRLRAKNDDVVCVFASVSDGKITFAAGCGKAALEAGANAGALLKALSPIVGGGGGGRPDSATSGGRDVSRLDEALGAAAACWRRSSALESDKRKEEQRWIVFFAKSSGGTSPRRRFLKTRRFTPSATSSPARRCIFSSFPRRISPRRTKSTPATPTRCATSFSPFPRSPNRPASPTATAS